MTLSRQLSPSAATEEERNQLRREYRLTQASSDFWVGFDSLNSRIHAVSDLLQHLRSAVEGVTVPAARPPAPTPEATPGDQSGSSAASPPDGPALGEGDLQWLLAAAAVLGGLTFFLLRQRRARMPAPRPQEVPDTERGGRVEMPPIPLEQIAVPPAAPIAAGEDAGTVRESPPARVAPAFNPDREEMDHALDLAEVMVSYGRKSGAVQTLKDFLREHPDVSVRPWLKLLELYRQTGMREDFEREAESVHQHFNVKVPGWDEGVSEVPLRSFFEDDEGVEILGLEQIPHILQKIQATWPGAVCQEYLQSLLLDNRGGGRQGFPVSVVAEILLLEDILTVRRAGPA